MSKPTEGPWIAYGGGKRRWAVGKAGGGHCVCQLTQHGDGESKANARLIAAAPELLEALKKCAAVCAGDTTHKDGLIEALELARKALAKAEAPNDV